MTVKLVIMELRRTMVLWLVLAMLLVTRALYEDAMDPVWPGLINKDMLNHRGNLSLLWPLAMAVGAGIGGRERAAGVADLFSSTPRGRWSRVAPTAALFGLGIAGAYLLTPADSLLLAALDRDAYWPAGWPWTLLVGALGVLAAGLLGLASGRLLPTRKLIPLFAVILLVLSGTAALVSDHLHSRAGLLVPSYLDSALDGEFATVNWRTNAGQAVWFLALAAAGYLLCALPRHPRRAALLPVALVLLGGLAGGLAVLPPAGLATRSDTRAAALVCADGLPRVCVTRVYAKVLPDIVGPAREALRALGRLPDPPSAIVQDTVPFGTRRSQPSDTVLVHLTVDGDGELVTGPQPIVDSLLAGAGTVRCEKWTDQDTEVRIMAARAVAAAWLLDRAAPPEPYYDQDRAVTDSAWEALHKLPPAAQRDRVAALRAASVRCRSDVYEVLLGSR